MFYRRLATAVLLALLNCLKVQTNANRNNDERTGSRSPCGKTSETKTNSFLWTVNNGPATGGSHNPHQTRTPSYFFGTIHVPYTRVWDLIPANTKEAFRQSDSVFFELDLLDHETVAALNSCQLLPRGETLADVVPRDLYRRLKRHLAYVRSAISSWMTPDQRARGLYADYLFEAITGGWERKRPVYVMLMVNSLTESDVRSRGTPVLDQFLAQESERLGKRRGAVELVEEHCVPLNDMDLSLVLFALNHTLHEQEMKRGGGGGRGGGAVYAPLGTSNTDSSADATPGSSANSRSTVLSSSAHTADDLVHHYNCGDLDRVLFTQDDAQIPSSLLPNISSFSPTGDVTRDGLSPPRGPAVEIEEYFREELIYKRNIRMADRVDRLLRENSNTRYFFAFGAGHFIGNNSVIDILRRRGYNITHTRPSDVIAPSSTQHPAAQRSPSGATGRPATTGGTRTGLMTSSADESDVRNARHRPTTRSRHERQKITHRSLTSTGAGVGAGAGTRVGAGTWSGAGAEAGEGAGTVVGSHNSRLAGIGSSSVSDSHHLRRPQFSELWVRLEGSGGFDTDSFIQQQLAMSATRRPTPSQFLDHNDEFKTSAAITRQIAPLVLYVNFILSTTLAVLLSLPHRLYFVSSVT